MLRNVLRLRGVRITASIVAVICAVVFMAVFVTGVLISFHLATCYESKIDIDIFTKASYSGATKIYYYEMIDRQNCIGEAIEMPEEQLHGAGNCIYVDYCAVPQDLVDAFVAIEDKRFWEHKGVDWRRTIRAVINYIANDETSFGGSTITQQLIKNITGERQYSKERKIQEIIWAQDLETKLSKNEIIELYMNVINLSHGCIGVQAAANTYFSKDVSELTLLECAAVAAITNNPYYYDPANNPENNAQRRDIILTQMLEQGYINEEEYASAYNMPLELNMSQYSEKDNINSWYTDMVIEDVISDLCQQYGYTSAAASMLVYSGGLHIYTAMDNDVQRVVEEYYTDILNFPTEKGESAFQSSMIVIDPYTGDILGVAGAIGEKTANRIQNYATQTKRPSGSVIKPVSVYAPALDSGIITSASVYDDVPLEFKLKNGQYTMWPQNSPSKYRGLTNVTDAIKDSVNTVAVRILEEIGVDVSFEFLYDKLNMRSLIVESRLENDDVITDKGIASLALGQQNYGVTVREMTGTYSIFVNDGIYNSMRSYYKVTDSKGNILLSCERRGERAISSATADIMTIMLENVVSSGTAQAITLDKKVAVAGKTGTTQDNCDKWFIGYTPYFVGGVWCGYEYPEPMDQIEGNPCVEIWDEVMTVLHDKSIYTAKNFDIGSEIIKVRCCADSGKLLTSACRIDARGNRGVWCYFESGTEPNEYCDCHIAVDYNTKDGGIACEDCSVNDIEKIGMIRVYRDFPTQVYVEDAQYVWRKMSITVPISHDENLPFFSDAIKKGRYCGISRGATQFNSGCRGEHWE